MTTHNIKSWVTCVVIGIALAGPQAIFAGDEVEAEAPSLYERLGGLAPISVVVSDFLDVLVPDPMLNENPAIDAARERVPTPYLKYHVTALMCQATGGPCRYHGRGMQESHAHLNITEQEWERMITLFKEVLSQHEVPEKETGELLEIIGSTKTEIVVPDQQRRNMEPRLQ